MNELMKVLKQVHGRAETRKGGGKKRNPQVSLFFSTGGGLSLRKKTSFTPSLKYYDSLCVSIKCSGRSLLPAIAEPTNTRVVHLRSYTISIHNIYLQYLNLCKKKLSSFDRILSTR